jgi:hypothetical protein
MKNLMTIWTGSIVGVFLVYAYFVLIIDERSKIPSHDLLGFTGKVISHDELGKTVTVQVEKYYPDEISELKIRFIYDKNTTWSNLYFTTENEILSQAQNIPSGQIYLETDDRINILRDNAKPKLAHAIHIAQILKQY